MYPELDISASKHFNEIARVFLVNSYYVLELTL